MEPIRRFGTFLLGVLVKLGIAGRNFVNIFFQNWHFVTTASRTANS